MSNNQTLSLQVEQVIKSVEDYEFEPIKGYPMLHWKGKRPFTGTKYYPAQLKENHGDDTNGWMNKIFWGDNLQVMSHLLKEYRGQVDLIYIDPPFDSKEDYRKKIQLKGASVLNDSSAFEEKQYTDIWSNDEYLQFMFERLILLRELLSERGSIYLHCDWHKAHFLRCILDEVFGASNFINEIIWKRGNHKKTENKFSISHDNIFVYSKTGNYIFNPRFIPYSKEYLDKYYSNIDSDGRRYQLQGMYGKGSGPALYFGDRLIQPPPGLHWRWGQDKINDAMDKGIIVFPRDGDGMPRFKDYLEAKSGVPIRTIWDDINEVNSQAIEREDYPTQKPIALLERIIEVSSEENSIILDTFMGSGTTLAAALQKNRRYIGADINLGAIQISTKRLLRITEDLKGKLQNEVKYTGFSVYNVNHYDVFRNPIQAKDILIKALEIQPLPNNNVYDGEKDGRMVKIMPINRISTRADLNELITNFDYKSFEKANEKSPGKAVEHLLLVCMGHEPDLAASLQSAVQYKLDIEVVDILRESARLEFKRDAEADIVVEGGRLVIKEFYPMNLLQKLSLIKENVENWKELVDSVMIDFNYVDAVFRPQIVDVPEGNKLVQGIYAIPSNAGSIRVKITDLLSETLEQTLKNG